MLLFITKKWIKLAVVDVAPVAAGLCIDILKLLFAIVCVDNVRDALFTVFSSCILSNITESACTESFWTVNSTLVAAANATAANWILPEVELISTSVVWLVACVTVPIPECTIPFSAAVIIKLPVLIATSCVSAATVNPAVAALPV